MTYRVARSYSEHGEIDLVNWCDCGSLNLELFSTSETPRASLLSYGRSVQGRALAARRGEAGAGGRGGLRESAHYRKWSEVAGGRVKR